MSGIVDSGRQGGLGNIDANDPNVTCHVLNQGHLLRGEAKAQEVRPHDGSSGKPSIFGRLPVVVSSHGMGPP